VKQVSEWVQSRRCAMAAEMVSKRLRQGKACTSFFPGRGVRKGIVLLIMLGLG
jgi:hypothetical protein